MKNAISEEKRINGHYRLLTCTLPTYVHVNRLYGNYFDIIQSVPITIVTLVHKYLQFRASFFCNFLHCNYINDIEISKLIKASFHRVFFPTVYPPFG